MIDTKLFCKALKFAQHASAKKDVRFYILGVHLEVQGSTLTLVGTDGHRLALAALRLDPTMPVDASITLPNDEVKRLLAVFGKSKGQISLDIALPEKPEGAPVLTVEADGFSLSITGIGGRYPDWRRVVPPLGRPRGPMPNLHGPYLAEACNALEPLAGQVKGTKALSFDATGGTDAVVVRPAVIHEAAVIDLLVVVMPTHV